MVLPTQGNSSQVAKSNLVIWRVAKWYSQLKATLAKLQNQTLQFGGWPNGTPNSSYSMFLCCCADACVAGENWSLWCYSMFWCCCADACVTGEDWSVWCYVLMLLCRCLCHWWGLVSMMLCFDVVVQRLVSLVMIGHYDVMFWCCCADACVTGEDWSVWCYVLMLLCRCLCHWWGLVSMMLCFDVVVQRLVSLVMIGQYDVTVCFDVVVQMLVSLVRIGQYDVTVCFDVVVQMLVSLVRIGQYDVMFWCCCADACVTGEDWSVWCYFLMLLCRGLCRWWWLVSMMLFFDVVVQMLVSLVRIGQYDAMFWCCCVDACVAGEDWSVWCYFLMLLCRCLCRWWWLVSMMLCFDVVVQMLVSLVRIGQYDAMFWCCCVDACVAGDDWSLWCYFLMLLCRCLCRWWWLVIMMLCFDVVVQMLVSLVTIGQYDVTVMFWCCCADACVTGEDWSVWCYFLMLLCRCLCQLVMIGQYDAIFWCCCVDACVAGDDWSVWCYVLMLLCRCLCHWRGLVIMMLFFDVVV